LEAERRELRAAAGKPSQFGALPGTLFPVRRLFHRS
jgi:hypothetical protein